LRDIDKWNQMLQVLKRKDKKSEKNSFQLFFMV